jgi:uncharacterized coiled-coil DUF342 family protein
MMMDDVHKRFHEMVRRRDRLRAEGNKNVGRLEAAKARAAEIRKTCEDKGIDPDKLPEFIQQVRQVYVQRVDAIEKQIQEAENKLASYLGGT